jgi:glycosyltransferase involved in cell wall biosynthesis
MEKQPKVSVLIPTYNYAYCLDECIQSVLNQTFQDFELIVIDDASRDNTDEVMQKYESDSRISYYRNPVNLGLVGNWNKCLGYAKGDYIKILCADDKFREDLLEKFVQVMETHPDVSLVACNKVMFGKSSVTVKLPLQHLQKGREVIYHTLRSFGWMGEPTCVMFRRKNLSVGLFKTDVVWLPDWEMWLRQLNVGDAYFIPEPLAYVQNHSGQLTKTVMKRFINYFEEYEMCRNIRDRKGYDFDLSGIDMNKVVKAKAENCARAMYKLFPKIYKEQERKIFFRAFRITLAENVFLSSLKPLFNKKPAKKVLTVEDAQPA